MSNFYNTPNMNLTVPTVNVDPGPDYASNVNASLTVIDSHNHSPGSGVLITPSGLNINGDLPINQNNLTLIRSVRFFAQASPLSGAADLGCLYEAGVDLYYNDGSGNQIRITQSGAVAGASGTITGLPSGTASASYQSISGTFQFQQSTGVAANIDAGSYIVRYPGSYPTPSGNAIVIEAPSSLSGVYALVLPALPAQTNVMTLSSAGVISSTTWDQVGVNMSSVGANAIFNSTTRPNSSSVGLGGFAIGGTSGSYVWTSSSVSPALSSCTIVTSGKPVQLGLTPLATGSFIGTQKPSNISQSTFYFYRDGIQITSANVIIEADGSSLVTSQIPVTSFGFTDLGASPGSHVYDVRTASSDNSTNSYVVNCGITAYEL